MNDKQKKLILASLIIVISGIITLATGYYLSSGVEGTMLYIVGFICLASLAAIGYGGYLVNKNKDFKDVDCEITWDSGSECINGIKNYNATVTKNQQNNGAGCPALSKIESCDNDCLLDWGDWSDCNKTTGNRDRYIKILAQPTNNGKVCPTSDEILTDPKYKQTEFCKVDCELSTPTWIPDGTCSATCGGGVQNYKRNVAIYPQNGGADCVDSNGNIIPETKTESCNTQACSTWNYKGCWGAWYTNHVPLPNLLINNQISKKPISVDECKAAALKNGDKVIGLRGDYAADGVTIIPNITCTSGPLNDVYKTYGEIKVDNPTKRQTVCKTNTEGGSGSMVVWAYQ